MEKVFIIDGPDGTGKTTLANKLSEIYNIPIYHLTYYKDQKKFQKQFDKRRFSCTVRTDQRNLAPPRNRKRNAIDCIGLVSVISKRNIFNG